MFRAVLFFAFLLAALPARAVEIRLAVPAAYADDAFLKGLSSAPELRGANLSLALRKTADGAEALRLAKSGEADIVAFSLADRDRKAVEKAGDESRLFTRAFVFSSAEEVFLMQKSFLGPTAMAASGETGLLPLRLWNHAIAYIVTREPVRGPQDFDRLKQAAKSGGADARLLSSAAAGATGGSSTGRLESELAAAARDLGLPPDQKLNVTIGWPETGVIAARPDFWTARSEVEKSAFSAALTKAYAAAEAEIVAREAALRANPKVEITRFDAAARHDLAMKAAGAAEANNMHRELKLWRRAEDEVHAAPAPALEPSPPMQTMALSPVFFATDRDDEGGAALATRFGARRLDPFEFSCGYLGAPKRNSGEPVIPAAPKTSAKGVDACAKMIVERTRAAGLKKILFVVHGFNTNFEGLLWRALQLGSDLDYDGALVGWSWPSEGSAFSYAYDEDSNAWSEPHFAELVGEVATQAPDLQLDFVAHSMGNRILLQMLREFAQAHSGIRIGAAIFAAPDIAQDVFRDQIRMASKIGVIRTLYASQYDHAIRISESYHKAPRAGSGGDGILVVKGVDSVDAELSGHSYLFDESKAIMDFRKVVNQATAAAARGLEKREKSGADYWVIVP